MKSILPAMQAHLDGELTTLAMLVKITRQDGVIKAFTTHDRDLAVASVTYKADGAMAPSMMQSTANLATDQLDLAGVLNSADITDSDLAAGRYDHARVDVAICNWADLSMGVVMLRRGWIGEVLRSGAQYVAELRGLHDLLQRPLGDCTTAECRFDLGDSRCGINLAASTVTGSVTSVASDTVFGDYLRSEASGVFDYAKLIWTSGANAGLSGEIKTWDGLTQNFTLWLPMPNPIMFGDAYSVAPGCDKRFSTCQSKFNNVVNFGGFPYVPGVGNILKYPETR